MDIEHQPCRHVDAKGDGSHHLQRRPRCRQPRRERQECNEAGHGHHRRLMLDYQRTGHGGARNQASAHPGQPHQQRQRTGGSRGAVVHRLDDEGRSHAPAHHHGVGCAHAQHAARKCAVPHDLPGPCGYFARPDRLRLLQCLAAAQALQHQRQHRKHRQDDEVGAPAPVRLHKATDEGGANRAQ